MKRLEMDEDNLQMGTAIGFRASHEH